MAGVRHAHKSVSESPQPIPSLRRCRSQREARACAHELRHRFVRGDRRPEPGDRRRSRCLERGRGDRSCRGGRARSRLQSVSHGLRALDAEPRPRAADEGEPASARCARDRDLCGRLDRRARRPDRRAGNARARLRPRLRDRRRPRRGAEVRVRRGWRLARHPDRPRQPSRHRPARLRAGPRSDCQGARCRHDRRGRARGDRCGDPRQPRRRHLRGGRRAHRRLARLRDGRIASQRRSRPDRRDSRRWARDVEHDGPALDGSGNRGSSHRRPGQRRARSWAVAHRLGRSADLCGRQPRGDSRDRSRFRCRCLARGPRGRGAARRWAGKRYRDRRVARSQQLHSCRRAVTADSQEYLAPLVP